MERSPPSLTATISSGSGGSTSSELATCTNGKCSGMVTPQLLAVSLFAAIITKACSGGSPFFPGVPGNSVEIPLKVILSVLSAISLSFTQLSEPCANEAKRSPITERVAVAQKGELRLTERLGRSVAAEQPLVERARGAACGAIVDRPQRSDHEW